jgi:hypothetical protein
MARIKVVSDEDIKQAMWEFWQEDQAGRRSLAKSAVEYRQGILRALRRGGPRRIHKLIGGLIGDKFLGSHTPRWGRSLAEGKEFLAWLETVFGLELPRGENKRIWRRNEPPYKRSVK